MLECLKCVSGTLNEGTSARSCLRLCLSLIRSATHLAVTYHNIKEKPFGGISTDLSDCTSDIINGGGQDLLLWNFLMNVLDETKVK